MIASSRFTTGQVRMALALSLGVWPLYGQPMPQAAAPPSPPPFVAEPITATFRLLLSASPVEKEQLLETHFASNRETIERKVREYNALPAEERDLRLRTLDLRHYLVQLRHLPQQQRSNYLGEIPAGHRKLVQERLSVLDQLPSALRDQVWEYEFARKRILAPRLPPLPARSARLSPRQLQIEQAAQRWQKLPQKKQAQVYLAFQGIFQVEDPPPQPVLDHLAEEDRRRMVRKLGMLKGLPPEERAKCLEGFQKFTALSPKQRAQFLINAERWTQMTEEERKVWSALVQRLPPMPPGLDDPNDAKRPPLPVAPATNPLAGQR